MALYNVWGGYQNPYLVGNTNYYAPIPNATMANYPTQQIQQTNAFPTNQTQSSIIWIKGGDDEAKMFPVAPNTAVALWSETEPVVYLKQADASGKPSLKIFDLVERVEPASEAGATPFASKDDISALVSMVKELSESVGSFKSELEVMKNDMYGIAGKKRSASSKKLEVEEDG